MKEYKNWQRFLVVLVPFGFWISKTAKIMFGPKGVDKKVRELSEYEFRLRVINTWISLVHCVLIAFLFVKLLDLIGLI